MWCFVIGALDTLVFQSTSYSSTFVGVKYAAASGLLLGAVGLVAGTGVVALMALRDQRQPQWTDRVLAAPHVVGLVLPVTLAALYWLHTEILGFKTSAVSFKGIAYTALVAGIAFGVTVGATRWVARVLASSPRLLASLAAAGGGLALGAIGVLLVPWSSKPAADLGPRAGKGNVILISIDSVRKDIWDDYLENYASSDLRGFAAASRRFTNAYTTWSHSLPSHASMLSGLYPFQHGAVVQHVGRQGEASDAGQPKVPAGRANRATAYGWWGTPLRDDVVLVSERLTEAGYQTCAILHNAWLGPPYGLEAGFETFVNGGVATRLGLFSPVFMSSTSLAGRYLYYADQHVFRQVHTGVRLLQKWIDRRERERPFFCFFHLMEMHVPTDPPRIARERFVRGQFAGVRARQLAKMIQSGKIPEADMPDAIEHFKRLSLAMLSEIDRLLQPVLETLQNEQLLDDTLVILTSDHGDDFFEKAGMLSHWHVYDTVARVPLLLRVPGDAGGSDWDVGASVVDFAPTIYRFTGVRAPGAQAGLDLLDPNVLEAARERAIFVQGANPAGGESRALVKGRYKLIGSPQANWELYDRANDGRELQDLASVLPELVLQLASELEARLPSSNLGRREAIQPEELPTEVLERLKALGYLD